MKLQLDTVSKTIKIEESVKLDELFHTLEAMLPNDQWKEFTLDITYITNWASPVIIQPPIIWPQQPPANPYVQPWQIPQPWYTTCGDKVDLNNGIYNVQVQS